VSWFGHEGDALARALDLPQVVAVRQVDSTMDAAHELAAAGAPAGTLVLAEEQRTGRGRGGKVWRSAPRAGVWMTVVERPRDSDALEVLSLRVGLALAPALQRWVRRAIQLKWPNDLLVDGRKLAGVLIEARWRDARADWVAIGVGVNLTLPEDEPAAAALHDADPFDVVAECLPAVRAAAFAPGPLRDAELAAYAVRDVSLGRAVAEPAAGTGRGISASGALLVETVSGVTSCRAGSLVLAPLS
jgi:BirA family biotin operon repressor/biotin-[acetyl-CoA-carboxylase] ligase